jgi:hypothetical protein
MSQAERDYLMMLIGITIGGLIVNALSVLV